MADDKLPSEESDYSELPMMPQLPDGLHWIWNGGASHHLEPDAMYYLNNLEQLPLMQLHIMYSYLMVNANLVEKEIERREKEDR